MTLDELLAALHAAGLKPALNEDGQPRLLGKAALLTADMRAALTEHRAALVSLLHCEWVGDILLVGSLTEDDREAALRDVRFWTPGKKAHDGATKD